VETFPEKWPPYFGNIRMRLLSLDFQSRSSPITRAPYCGSNEDAEHGDAECVFHYRERFRDPDDGFRKVYCPFAAI
jgi:hypothetical protein